MSDHAETLKLSLAALPIFAILILVFPWWLAVKRWRPALRRLLEGDLYG